MRILFYVYIIFALACSESRIRALEDKLSKLKRDCNIEANIKEER